MNQWFMLALNVTYCCFYGFIFIEILRFLIKPSYINKDIITASACGYFLLVEMSVFLMQAFYYSNNHSFKGMSDTFSVEKSASIFMDLVYFLQALLL